MSKILVLVVLFMAGVAGADPSDNTVPLCPIETLATCIGGPEPGRTAWVLNAADDTDYDPAGPTGTFEHMCQQKSDRTFAPIGSAAGGLSGHTIQEEGATLQQRSTMNFLGTAITCVDNAGKTECTVAPSGGAGDVTGGSTSTSGEIVAYSNTTGKVIGRTSGLPIGGGATPGIAHAIFYDTAVGRWVSRSIIDAATYLSGSFGHSQIADLFAGMLGGPMAVCATGFVRGGEYNATENTFAWTCGNYPWSAEFGGSSGGIGNYSTATTAGGNSETATCAYNGWATTAAMPGGYAEGACFETGQIVKKNAMADLMLAHDFTRRNGRIYVPPGTYELAGCGARSTGSPNNCPVLRAPFDEHYQRDLQSFGGRKFVGAGMDQDGPYEPVTGKRITGTYLIVNRGKVGSTDGNGDGAVLLAWGQQIGAWPLEGRTCTAASPSPVCDINSVARSSVTDNQWGIAATILAASIPPADNTDYVCVDNRESTTGTCTGDRRITCSADATCSGFSPSLGTCEGFVDAMEREVRDNGRQMVATFISPTCSDDEIPSGGECSDVPAGNSGYLSPVNKTIMPLYTCGPSANGKWMQFGPTNSTAVGFYIESQRIPLGSVVYATDLGVLMNEGGGIEGVTLMQASPKGRVAGDLAASGVATSGSGSTTLISSTGGLSNHAGRTLILAGGTKKEQIRKIVSNTTDTFTVTPAWTNDGPVWNGDPLLDLPLSGETWRVSTQSCASDEVSCDIGIVLGMQASYKGGFTKSAIWYPDATGTFVIDGSLTGHKIEFADNLVSRMVGGAGTDASDWIFQRNIWLNNECTGGSALHNLGFVGGSVVQDEMYIGNRCNLASTTAQGGNITMQRIHAVGNVGTLLNIVSRQAGVYRDFSISGQRGSIVKITPGNNGEVSGSVSFKGFRIYGQPSLYTDGQYARAFVAIGSLQGTSLGRLKNVLFEDWQLRTNAGEYNCFAAFDYDRDKYTGTATAGSGTTLDDNTSTPWPAGTNGAKGLIVYIRPGTATQQIRTINSSSTTQLVFDAVSPVVAASDAYAIHEPISEDMGQVAFRDIGMEEIGTTAKVSQMFCAMDFGDTTNAAPLGCNGGAAAPGLANECNSSDNVGIWTTAVQPIIDNVRLNGVPISNQLYPTLLASQAQTCDLTPDSVTDVGVGATVRIRDDSGTGVCKDTTPGTLTGGGGYTSTCVCASINGVADWVPLSGFGGVARLVGFVGNGARTATSVCLEAGYASARVASDCDAPVDDAATACVWQDPGDAPIATHEAVARCE